MSSPSLRALLDFAVEAAWQAGRLTLAHFQADVAIERKADETPVTIADRDGERLLRRLIERAFPEHEIVGEEFGATQGASSSSHRWILDPIDGTQSFIRGVPLYGVLVGLEIEGEMAVGVVHFPALGEMVAAARGEGCRWNGRTVRVSRVDRLADALVAYTDAADLQRRHPEGWARLQAQTRLQRGWSDCYAYTLVATGRAEIALDARMSPWDCAALVPILREAGGTFTDWAGTPTIAGGNGLATNGRLFEDVLGLLR
jgi:histidinol phosphatase-like enzyme (inositol monophosphatase family)